MSNEEKKTNYFGRTAAEELNYQKSLSPHELSSYLNYGPALDSTIHLLTHPECRCCRCLHDDGGNWCDKLRKKPSEVIFDNAECAHFVEGKSRWWRHISEVANSPDEDE